MAQDDSQNTPEIKALKEKLKPRFEEILNEIRMKDIEAKQKLEKMKSGGQ